MSFFIVIHEIYDDCMSIFVELLGDLGGSSVNVNGEGGEDVAARALIGALVWPLDPVRLALGLHGNHRLFVGEQDPIPLGLGQFAPGSVDVIAEGGQLLFRESF